MGGAGAAAELRLVTSFVPKTVLLVCTQRIGDVLLATPLARAIKRAWPDAAIDFVVFKGTEGVLQGNPDIRQVWAFPHRSDWRSKWQQLRSLWNQYDLALSTVPTDRARLYAWVGGRRRFGFISAEEKGKTWMLDGHVLFDDRDTHTVAMGLSLCALLGIAPVYKVVPPRLSGAALESCLAQVGRKPYAVLHPFPKYAYKMWRQEGWVELARKLQDQYGLDVVLTGGPDADEQAYCASIAQACGANNLAGRLSLAATAELIARSQLFVGPDTAATHMAAATGVPTVALFGPSNPVKWGPWPHSHAQAASPWPRVGRGRQGNVYLLQGRAGECVPCLLEGCERSLHSRSDCLLSISVDEVWAAITHFPIERH